jgi:hypothetical protein
MNLIKFLANVISRENVVNYVTIAANLATLMGFVTQWLHRGP